MIAGHETDTIIFNHSETINEMNFSRQPFKPDIDTAFFYGGGSRREVVDDIKTALVSEVPLVTLTGTEGSGKTMICRMVEKELSGQLLVLFLDSGVASFDEVVDGITAVAGFAADGIDRSSRLEQAVSAIREQNRRLVVILDSAEKIFPATLERIRRMLDQVNSEQVLVQLLFSGQPLFSINFKQLGIIPFNQVEEKHFSLDTLNSEDTYQYLNHCLEIAGGGEQDLFSAARADRIMDIARGNFRLINELADKYLRSVIVVDPNEVKTGGTDPENLELDDSDSRLGISIGPGNVDLDFLKIPKIGFRWYAVGGAVIAVILLLFLLTGGDDEEPEPLPESAKVPDLTLENVEPDRVEIPRPTIEPESLELPPPEEAAREAAPETAPSKPAAVQALPPQLEEQREKPAETVKPKLAEPLAEPEQTAVSSPAKEKKAASGQVAADKKPEIAIIAERLKNEAAMQSEQARQEEQQPLTPAIEETETTAETLTQSEPAAAADKPVEAEPPAQAAKPEQIETVSERVASAAKSDTAATAPGPSEKPQEIEKPVLAKPEPLEQPDESKKAGAAEPGLSEQPEKIEKPVLAKAEQLEQPDEISNVVAGEPGPSEQPEKIEKPVLTKPESLEQADETAKTVAAEPGPPEQPEEAEKTVSTEPEPIPQLSVVTKKKQLTEPPPVSVVTLKDESKQSPESTVTAPVREAEPKPVVEQVERVTVQQEPPPPAVERQTEIRSIETQPETVAAVPEAAPLSSIKPPAPQRPAPSAKDPALYYAERLAAGSRWLVGGSSSKYTVQLMVLNSDEAEQNVRQMLNNQSYQPLRDKLYILRRSGQPQTVMLYFGEFDSQVEAHQAKSNLPSFLTRLDPYAISVKEAVAKARSSQ